MSVYVLKKDLPDAKIGDEYVLQGDRYYNSRSLNQSSPVIEHNSYFTWQVYAMPDWFELKEERIKVTGSVSVNTNDERIEFGFDYEGHHSRINATRKQWYELFKRNANALCDNKYSKEDMKLCDDNAYWRGIETQQQQLLSQINRDKDYSNFTTRLSFEDFVNSLNK